MGWPEYSTNYLPNEFVIEVDIQDFEESVKTFAPLD